MSGFLAPQPAVPDRDRVRGLNELMWDATFAALVGALNSGVVMAAFAIWLGASNTVIGVLAAVPLWTQVLQAPAVSLVERLRARRRIAIISLFVARLALPCMALLPLLPDRRLALALLVALETIHTGLNAICACAWNVWVRDLVPEAELGQFFARRTIFANAIGIIASLTAGFALQWQHATGAGIGAPAAGRVFTVLYLLGFVAGMVSTWRLAHVPEPLMPPPSPKQTLWKMLKAPLKDRNFRNLIRFMASWQFAVNLATPFFTVYFARQLHLGMGWITAFTVVSQLANVAVLRGWGRLADRFSNTAVLNVAAPAFLLCIAGMIGASQIEGKATLIAYLCALHVLMGMAAAGVGLASGNVALKLAPSRGGTAYIAANALISSVAAGAAPILGGLSADFYAARELAFQVLWRSPRGVQQVMHVEVSHWDFFFLIAACVGLYALHRLTWVREEGGIRRRAMLQQILDETSRGVRNLSPVRGLRPDFPSSELLDAHARFAEQKRAERARQGRAAAQRTAARGP
jgi:MFS family permease